MELLKKNEQLIFTMENKQFSDLRAVLMSILYLVKASIESMNNLILVNTLFSVLSSMSSQGFLVSPPYNFVYLMLYTKLIYIYIY